MNSDSFQLPHTAVPTPWPARGGTTQAALSRSPARSSSQPTSTNTFKREKYRKIPKQRKINEPIQIFSAGAVHGGPRCPPSLPPTPWGLQGNNIFPGFWNWLIFSGAQRPPECRLRVGLRVGRGRQHDEQHRHRRRLHPLQHEHHRHQPQHHVSGYLFTAGVKIYLEH